MFREAESSENNYNGNEKNNNAGIEFRMFPSAFTVLKIAGFWTPTNMKFPLNLLYEIYKIFCFISVVFLFVTMIIYNIISAKKSWRPLIENIFLLLTISNGLSKILNVLIRRSKIIHTLEKQSEDRWTILKDENEIAIIQESQRLEKFMTQFFLIMVIINDISNALKPILLENAENLMVDAYTPCDLKHPFCYWVCYIYQCFGYGVTSMVHVSGDGLMYNFIDRLCAHLKILENRLLKLPILVESADFQGKDKLEFEQNYLKKCIKDHHSIFEQMIDVNKIFYELVFAQYCSSILILCTNIYLLSGVELFSPDFITITIYLSCAMVQNFFYCWYGYKVTFDSFHLSESIFNMNWCVLQFKTRKMLLYMMLRTSSKIELFNSSVISLTPESFINILKVTYSAFNILQQTTK